MHLLECNHRSEMQVDAVHAQIDGLRVRRLNGDDRLGISAIGERAAGRQRERLEGEGFADADARQRFHGAQARELVALHPGDFASGNDAQPIAAAVVGIHEQDFVPREGPDRFGDDARAPEAGRIDQARLC